MNNTGKVVYIISGVHNSISMEWMLDSMKNKMAVAVILLDNRKTIFYDYLQQAGIENQFIELNSKKEYPKVFWKVFRTLRKMKPTAVHCHLFEANLIGLSAAKLLGIANRTYTRHHSTFHQEYAPKGVKYDKLCNQLAKKVVAISPNVKNVLVTKEGLPEEKVALVRHGFNTDYFSDVESSRIEALKKKYDIHKAHPVIGVISRYIEWKGTDYAVAAFEGVLKKYPRAKLLIANALGNDRPAQIDLIQEAYPGSIVEIEYERDTAALYKCMDVYVHVPIDREIEAFGQTYIESMLAQTPSVVTISGIGAEVVKKDYNAKVVEYKDSKAIEEAIFEVLESSVIKEGLKDQYQALAEDYSVERMTDELVELYME